MADMIFKDWLSFTLQVVSLAAIVFSAIKVINRNIHEWTVRETRLMEIERRITDVEKELRVVNLMGKDISAILTKQIDFGDEVSRLRNRLDRFLDDRTVRTPKGRD